MTWLWTTDDGPGIAGAWWRAKACAEQMAEKTGRAFAVVSLPRPDTCASVWAMPAADALDGWSIDVALIVEPAL